VDVCQELFGKSFSELNTEEKRRFRNLARKASYYRRHDYHKRQQVLRRRDRKKEILDAIGRAAKCERCGYDRCIAALDFHHREPHEKDSLVTALPIGRAIEEAKKCVVLCANCHREEHHNTKAQGRPRQSDELLEKYLHLSCGA